MKTLLTVFLATIALAWGWDIFYVAAAPQGALPWLLRQQALFLSGLWSICLMSLVMVLATRPGWLEKPLGGMDRMYRLHKWAGILAIVFAAGHWLLDLSGGLLKTMIGSTGKPPKFELSALAQAARPLAKDLGEWIIYAMLIMLVITLWKRFPYKFWRHVHRVMPPLYLGLIFHTAALAPPRYWTQPIGILLAICLTAGTVASVLAMIGFIGKRRKTHGSVVAVRRPAGDVTEVTCRLDHKWPGHRPGQFAFVTFDCAEGPHPFTIASAHRNDRTVSFMIKTLGDHTAQLADTLAAGQAVTVEGPYGYFDFTRGDPQAKQVWIAGGIGITPFIAWLESLQDSAMRQYNADLHYFVRDADHDPFVKQLESLCAGLPGIRLNIHGHSARCTNASDNLFKADIPQGRLEVWFCGPSGLADKVRNHFKDQLPRRFTFHQEAFEIR